MLSSILKSFIAHLAPGKVLSGLIWGGKSCYLVYRMFCCIASARKLLAGLTGLGKVVALYIGCVACLTLGKVLSRPNWVGKSCLVCRMLSCIKLEKVLAGLTELGKVVILYT